MKCPTCGNAPQIANHYSPDLFPPINLDNRQEPILTTSNVNTMG